MRMNERLQYLQNNHFKERLSAKQEADNIVSEQHPMICVCGKLCTGLHELNCSRFKKKVQSLAVKSLKHLLPTKIEGLSK